MCPADRPPAPSALSAPAPCPAGVLLCDLVAAIEGAPVPGVCRPPRSRAAARGNVARAPARLARPTDMGRRFLLLEDDILAGDRHVLLGLLEEARPGMRPGSTWFHLSPHLAPSRFHLVPPGGPSGSSWGPSGSTRAPRLVSLLLGPWGVRLS